MKAKRKSIARRPSPDRISALPQTIIEVILCLLSIEEAARTSILSREWRYKWTKIPKLVFAAPMFYEGKTKEEHTCGIERARETMDYRCKGFYVLHQILLMRQGPIHEFTLSMYADFCCYEIDQIILYLSRNHPLKKLKLELHDEDWYMLPLSAFSLHHLTDLHLHYIDLDRKPTFGGFGSLQSLYLTYVRTSTKALLHLLSNCPSLKSFTLLIEPFHLYPIDCTITEFLECLPMIEHLTTWGYVFPWLKLDSVPKELPTSLIHLKYFCFEKACFDDSQGLFFLAVLIKCSPNLEKIRIENDVEHLFCHEDEKGSDVFEECYDVWLEHLTVLEIKCFINLKGGLEFVKFILARSPKLKKVRIMSSLEKDEEFDVLKVLLRAPRASPVEIIVDSLWERW